MSLNQDQSMQKVNRKLLYKELIEKGAKVGEALENQDVMDTFSNIMEIIDMCENVSTDYARDGKIENTADYLMDAQIIKMSHDLMGTITEKLACNDFREDEYMIALIDLMSVNHQSEDEVTNIAMKCGRTTDVQLCLLGSFDFNEAPRPEKIKKVNQRAKNKIESMKAPENVKQLHKEDKGAEKINITRSEIQKACRERKTDCLPYFELVINPHSFMKSVDVAFQISFLVRDGILGIKRINDEPFIFLYDPNHLSSASHSQRLQAEDTVQTVMTLDLQTWEEEIKKNELKAPLLKLVSFQHETDEDDSDES